MGSKDKNQDKKKDKKAEKKAAKLAAAKAAEEAKRLAEEAAKKAAEAAASSSSSSSDSDSSSDEEEKAPPKKVAKKKVPAKKEESSSSSSDSSSDEEEKAPPKKVAKKKVPAKKEESSSSSSDSSSDEEEKAPPPKKKTSKKKEESFSSDSSDDDDEPPVTKQESETPSTKRKRDDTAAEENGQSTPKRPAVEDEGETKVHIKGLPWTATADEVTDFFKACGEITECELPIQDDGRSSGTANVTFTTAEAFDAALAKSGEDFNGRWVIVKPHSQFRAPDRAATPKAEGCTSIFMGNLAWSVDEDSIRSVFKDCGTIEQIRFAEDRETGEFRGFGHIDFAETEATDEAMKLSGTDVCGRAIRIDYSNPRGFSGGGGRGGGKGGGRGGGKGGGGKGGGSGFKAKQNGSIASFSGSKITFD